MAAVQTVILLGSGLWGEQHRIGRNLENVATVAWANRKFPATGAFEHVEKTLMVFH